MGAVEVPLPQEPLVAPAVQGPSVEIPMAVRPPEVAPEPVARAAVKEPVKPPLELEMVAEHPFTPGVAEEATILEQEPALDAAAELTRKKSPLPRRALPWAAAGIAALVLPCIGALVALNVIGPISGISLTSLQLPSLCPGSLLLLSGASFAGAVLLLGLLLWARRGNTS